MRRAILPLTLVALGFVLLGWLIWTAFGSQRDDVAVARGFLTHIAAADYGAAQDLMTPALALRAGSGILASGFGEIEPWEAIRFSSRSTNSNGGTRRTDLTGRGTTITGCVSNLRITLVDGLVDAFDVSPLCPVTDVEA